MKKNIKNQKGAISLFVLLSMMFFLAFMLGAFTMVNRRNATQVEALKEIEKIYGRGSSAKDTYDSIFASSSSSSVVPITNIEQLKNVEKTNRNNTTIKYLINGKVYTYAQGATYVLQNDIILDLEDTIDGKNNLGQVLSPNTDNENIIYDYVLYNSDYNVNLNGHSIYYQKDDGSLWKLVCYQNMGTSPNYGLFSSDSTQPNYQGKSYNEMTFSILDDGISPYSHLWSSVNSNNQNFEFMLMYNNTNGDNMFDISGGMYNRWRQTINPTKEDEEVYEDGTAVVTGYTHDFDGGTAKLAGYTGVASSYESNNEYTYWGGLVRSSSQRGDCYLNGAVGKEDNWYFPVCVKKSTWKEGKMPATKLDGTTIQATESLLFVRYK